MMAPTNLLGLNRHALRSKVQETFAQKLSNCSDCEFYKLVYAEQGREKKSHNGLLLRP